MMTRFGKFLLGRRIFVASLLLVSLVGRPLPAQQTKKAKPVASVPRDWEQQAYQKTKTAEKTDEYSEIIDLCKNALRTKLSSAKTDYAKRLLSWAYNRRGESLVDQAEAITDKTKIAEVKKLESQALHDFNASIKTDPNRWRAIHNRAVSLAQAGKHEESLQDFARTIELRPKFASAWFNRAEIRYQLGRYTEALKDYDQAIRLKNDDIEAYNGRGHVYYRLGKYDQAWESYNQAVERAPQDAVSYVNRADASADLARWEKAAKDYRQAIKLDKNLARAYQGAAWLMATCPDDRYRQPELAIEAAKKAIELAGANDYRSLDTLAAAQASLGQYEQAQATLGEAIQAAPENAVPRLSKRMASYQAGKPYRAVARVAAKARSENR